MRGQKGNIGERWSRQSLELVELTAQGDKVLFVLCWCFVCVVPTFVCVFANVFC